MPYTEKISQLFLGLEAEMGITGMDDVVLSALLRAIHDFKEKGEEDFLTQFYELFENVKNTQPRIAIVIDHFFHLWNTLSEAKETKHPEGHLFWERKIIGKIKEFRVSIKEEKCKLFKTGAAQIRSGDVILIHGLSSSVFESLFRAKRNGKKFKIIVAEQELEKTQKIIELLSKHRISFQVIPEYMLSHIESEVTKVFFGAVTINSNLHVVCDAGVNAIVSEFHLRKTPIYLFLLIRKFSLWKSSAEHHRYKATSTRTHGYKPISFERIKFSHDRVPLDHFKYVVTEKGKLKPAEIKEIYDEKFAERAAWRAEFFRE